MKQIAKNFKGYYKKLILGPLFKLLEAVLELLVPLVVANMIDKGIASGDSGYIVRNGLLLLLIAALGVGAAMLCQYFAAVSAGGIGKKLRIQTFHHVMKFSDSDIGNMGSGGLITRLTNDINQVQTGINMLIRLGTRVPFLAIGSIVMALMIDWKIGIIFLVTTPLIAFVLYVIMKKTLPSYKDIQSGQDRLSRLSGENLEGVRVIRAFSKQEHEQEAYENAADDLTALTIRVGKISAALNPVTAIIVNLAIALIVYMGANFVFSGNMETGQIIALVSYMNQTLLALIVAANLIILFTRALASVKRVEAVLETEPSITDKKELSGRAVNEAKTKEGKFAVQVKNLSFAYHDGADNVLEDISFSIKKGTITGIIGGTGSGKTTLINLLLRHFEITRGEIKFGNEKIEDMPLKVLRGKMSVVPQRAVLFSGTIRENLQMANPQATEAEMTEALKIAQAYDFVEKSPRKLNTYVEESGKNFSGGQRQRLTIARALTKKSEILILDDSSSALDYQTDAALRMSLKKEMKKNANLTVLMITQRAATIKQADQILVLEDGRMAGAGTHEILLNDNEVYQEICESQGILPKNDKDGEAQK